MKLKPQVEAALTPGEAAQVVVALEVLTRRRTGAMERFRGTHLLNALCQKPSGDMDQP